MDSEDGERPLRRSGRRKTEISYKDLEARSSNSATPEAIGEPYEADGLDELDEPDEPDAAFVDEPVPERRGRKRRAPDDTDHKPGNKQPGVAARGWDDRIYALGGTDRAAMAALGERVEKWKEVLTKIPDELVDYTIGWGICEGSWGPEPCEQQKAGFIPLRLFLKC